jgi:hypothetical protein
MDQETISRRRGLPRSRYLRCLMARMHAIRSQRATPNGRLIPQRDPEVNPSLRDLLKGIAK